MMILRFSLGNTLGNFIILLPIYKCAYIKWLYKYCEKVVNNNIQIITSGENRVYSEYSWRNHYSYYVYRADSRF